MKSYHYLIVCQLVITAESREAADAEFREEYSDNLNQHISCQCVEEEEEEEEE